MQCVEGLFTGSLGFIQLLGLFGNQNVLVRFDEHCQRTLAHAEFLTPRSLLSARYQNVVPITNSEPLYCAHHENGVDRRHSHPEIELRKS